MFDEKTIGKGARKDIPDWRDRLYDDIVAGAAPLSEEEWNKGYDVEKELNIKIKIKNQFGSSSCVGQSYSYYGAVKNAAETGKYDEQTAKAIYSMIALGSGGAYFRDGAAHLVDFGALTEAQVPSYKADGTTDEPFMRDKSWLTDELRTAAKILGAKEYRGISGITMDIFARAIKENHGIVYGVIGNNNGTWFDNEPQPPTSDIPQNQWWYHALYGGKFGVDEKGKFIASPNSWGLRNTDPLHPDGWQKYRESWFAENGRWLFSAWTIIDKPNFINKTDMITIKKTGSPAVYLLAGDKLIPFATTWEIYKAEFPEAQIIELSDKEFAKLKLSGLKIIK